MSASPMAYNKLLELYHPPAWLDGKVKYQPKYRIKLANLPTPIHHWPLADVPTEFTLHIKRDDCTESSLSGNKVRKLEFLLADALDKGCKQVITWGSLQSNHCRATALAAARCGLTSHLLLLLFGKSRSDVGCQANLLLNRLSGARMYVMEKPYTVTDLTTTMDLLTNTMDKLAEQIKASTGEKSYKLEVGGLNYVGIYGYIHAFEELMQQGVLEQYDDIVVTVGIGGTAAGLAVGNYLTGSKLKVHGVMVGFDKQFVYTGVNKVLQELGLKVEASSILDIIDDYIGEGYGISTQDEQDFITKVSVQTGILLDHVYTVKGVYGMVQEMTKSPDRFQGRRVLFILIGGLFELYDGDIDNTLTQEGAKTNRIVWLTDQPFPII